MTVLSLRFRARAFSSRGKRGPLPITARRPPTTAAPPAAEHRLQTRRPSSRGPRAQPLRGTWDPPRPGPEPASPAPAGRLPTTAPPGKPLEQLLLHPIGFGSSCFCCHLFLGIFWYPLWFLQWSLGYLVMYCLASMCLCFLRFIPPVFISNLIALWSEKMLDMISIFLNLLRLDLWPRCDLSWRMFHVHLRRKRNLLFSDGMSYKYQLNINEIYLVYCVI